MSTIINDLYIYGIQVLVVKDGNTWAVDVKYIKDDDIYEDGEYLAGYSDFNTQEDAEFLARAWIDGYKLSRNSYEYTRVF